MKLSGMFRVCGLLLLMMISLIFSSGLAETPLAGAWVYENDQAVTVLTLREDGSAIYGGQELTWQDEETAILLKDEAGGSFHLAYATAEDSLTVWLPTRFERISEIGGEGELTGTWMAEGESRSSFVFTEDGRFLEDGVFTGNFLDDPENGRVTLKYMQGMFADTMILYSFDGDILVVGYPWKLIRKNVLSPAA